MNQYQFAHFVIPDTGKEFYGVYIKKDDQSVEIIYEFESEQNAIQKIKQLNNQR